jgi:hypothetical protein
MPADEDPGSGVEADPADGDESGSEAAGEDGAGDASDGDTFGVGVHVTEEELRFVVHVPSAIDSGWTDPQEFQSLVERIVWERLDRETILGRVAAETPAGETVPLGTVTLRPDRTVVDESLSAPNLS